jgi:hypothetical protein
MAGEAYFLAQLIASSFREKRLVEGLEAIVEAYYEEYTDAEELDGEFRSALEKVFDVCFPCGVLADDREFEDLIRKPGAK